MSALQDLRDTAEQLSRQLDECDTEADAIRTHSPSPKVPSRRQARARWSDRGAAVRCYSPFMNTEPENPVLELLRAIRTDIAEVKADIRDLKQRMSSMVRRLAVLTADRAGTFERYDRLAERVARIERRLALSEP